MAEINFVFVKEELDKFWEEHLKPLLKGEAAGLQAFVNEVDGEFATYLRGKAEGDPQADILLANLVGQARLKAAQYDITATDAAWDAIELAFRTAGKMFGIFLGAAVGL